MKTFATILAVTLTAALTVACKSGGTSSETSPAAVPAAGCNDIAVAAPASSNGDMFEIRVIADSVNPDGSRTVSALPCADVCSSQIDVTVKDGVIIEVVFTGGCPGNTTGVANLVKGMTVKEAVARMDGIDCGGRGTSCPDQLTRVLKLFL